MSTGSRWSDVRAGVTAVRQALRFLRLARLKRRALELRDDGQLDAALAVHRRAFEVAASGPDPKPLGMLVDMTFSFLVRSEQQVRERLENVRSEL